MIKRIYIVNYEIRALGGQVPYAICGNIGTGK